MSHYQNVLVAVDGSKEAEKAFKKAIHVAKRNRAKLVITNGLLARNLYFLTVKNKPRLCPGLLSILLS